MLKMERLITLSSLALVVLLFSIYTNGHGVMVMPHNWFDQPTWLRTGKGLVYDYVGIKSGYQCYTGCNLDGKTLCPKERLGCAIPDPGCSCMWFKNWTFIAKPKIFDKKLLTYNYVDNPRKLLNHPWRSPGVAYVDSPCGVAGGNIYGCFMGNCSWHQLGYGYGVSSLDYKFPHNFYVTKWKRGSVVEAAWAITANHGGGYNYRLCKIPKEGISGITEKICQKIPLRFFGKNQSVQYGEDISTRISFPAVRTTKGTFPPGSQWTKNPIPACKCDNGGATNPTQECIQGYQFPPPGPGLWGFGINDAGNYAFKFSIIDKLIIPTSIEPGVYVLSFRWDCEQTPQVWNSCASIQIE